MTGDDLRRTALHPLHVQLGAKMVPFAGYEMPVQYADGIIDEHRHTRSKAALFDVGHMGQARLTGDLWEMAFEALAPTDVTGLADGRMRYTQLTNEAGGIIDDLMVARLDGAMFMVVNASRKELDFEHLRAGLGGAAEIEVLADHGLIALQGPAAGEVLARHAPGVDGMKFMDIAAMEVAGAACLVSRSGYTGEDGFEISVPATDAVPVAESLLAEAEVAPAGLGARDTLRLEAGLCLHGSDIDETTTPVEADLLWSIPKQRRENGGFPGAAVIQRQIADGPARRRIGLRLQGRAPARAHAEIRSASGDTVGEVTSGGYCPTVDGPVAMGYVGIEHTEVGSVLDVMVRGRGLAAEVVTLPFVAHQYRR